jgi:translation initiation factor 4A
MSEGLENEVIENSGEVFNEIHSWDEFQLDPNILRGIYSYGFEKPSPIQRRAIQPIIAGRDVIAQAQSGTGKTAAFTIGALTKIDLSKDTTQVLILSPTRELTIQTSNVINQIGSMMKDLRVQTLFGGTHTDESTFFGSRKNHHIVCGCPGRVYDMMRRNKLRANKIKLIILDEADEMLSSGFKDQVYNIFQYLQQNVQVALFSATLPEHMFAITQKFMNDPVRIIVRAEQLTLEGISQYYVAVEDDRQKYDALKDLYKYISVSQCIIYCNSVRRVAELYEAMKDDEFPVCCIHSKMTKQERDNAFSDFRNGKSRVLISSNVTARGIDIQQVSIVINFDIPKCVYTYLHRIGRSGRWGRKGVGINFITRRDIIKLREIEQYYACEIKELPANLNFSDKV